MKELIGFFNNKNKIKTQELSKELTIELIGLLCEGFNYKNENMLIELEDYLFYEDDFKINLENNSPILIAELNELFDYYKLMLLKIENLINYFTISLNSELIYPKYKNYPSISNFKGIDVSLNSFEDFIKFVKKHYSLMNF